MMGSSKSKIVPLASSDSHEMHEVRVAHEMRSIRKTFEKYSTMDDTDEYDIAKACLEKSNVPPGYVKLLACVITLKHSRGPSERLWDHISGAVRLFQERMFRKEQCDYLFHAMSNDEALITRRTLKRCISPSNRGKPRATLAIIEQVGSEGVINAEEFEANLEFIFSAIENESDN
eukprot:TRINITY_DN3643_c0_g1_i1.p1 TRINITY_DN3643_c0_g1~~TRINITY_DN3643_c0_g1_i1.p1  ORF type:complete len:175 (+),score=22.66 TRINITY_DN3643_c0_g1_i1:64-588(+)